MDDNEVEVFKQLIDEQVADKPLTKEDAIFEIVTMLLKSTAENMHSIVSLAEAAKKEADMLRVLDMRLSVIELAVLPYLKDIKGIAEC
jgi:hypothetical protein